MQQIDLRSDTVTRPTPGMREAMLNAEVGDDVYGDDPTVNELQEYAAQGRGRGIRRFGVFRRVRPTFKACSECGDGVVRLGGCRH